MDESRCYDPAYAVSGLAFKLEGKCIFCSKTFKLKESIQDLKEAISTARTELSKGRLVGCGSKWFCSDKCIENWQKQLEK